MKNKYIDIPIKNNSYVISAPTGSGKTTSIINNLKYYVSGYDKIFLLFPTKALVSEIVGKLEDRNISYLRDDSDARLIDDSITTEKWNDFQIIVTTYEKADSIFLKNPLFLRGALVFIDEIHVAIQDDRALSILSIMAEAKEEGAKIILASATLPNLSELTDYLQAEEIIMEDKRNPKITKISIGDRPWKGKYYFELIMPHILEEVKKAIAEDRKIIIFRPSRKQCEWIAGNLNKEGIPTRVHHAGVPFYERKEIENDFKNTDKFNVIVATHTLAYGVNLPADTIILAGLSIYLPEEVKTISSVDIMQMLGRAGRPNISKYLPEAVIIYASEEVDTVENGISGNYSESIGLKYENLDTLLMRMVAVRRITSYTQVEKIPERFFNVPEKFYWDRALEKLKDLELIKGDGIEENYTLTERGYMIAKYFISVKSYEAIYYLITDSKEEINKIKRIYNLIDALSEEIGVHKEKKEVETNSLLFSLPDLDIANILAVLLYPDGDTVKVAESIKRYSYFLAEINKNPEYKEIATMMKFVRLAQLNRFNNIIPENMKMWNANKVFAKNLIDEIKKPMVKGVVYNG